jgi:three-Cys-motif partner protein
LIPSLQQFGDKSWTQDKLERVRKYLVAYSTIMRKRRYIYAYIDAFAGTGYHELKQAADSGMSLFPEEDEPEIEAFLHGSARIALQVEPRFNDYIFIEKSRKKAAELEKLKDEFPDKAGDIAIETQEANAYLQQLCRRSWKAHRAVLFIDPFGMQLMWKTVEAIGRTKAIDTWILFPVSAVNRLLKKDGNIPPEWRKRLDMMFGEPSWFDVFFPKRQGGLFETDSDERVKAADMKVIGNYFNQRLASAFAGVAPKPYTLRNSRGSPLFLLCFAAANPQAAPTAIKIAQDILRREPV